MANHARIFPSRFFSLKQFSAFLYAAAIDSLCLIVYLLYNSDSVQVVWYGEVVS